MATVLNGGRASIPVAAGSLAVGSDTLTATYTPDTASSSTYNSSTAAATVVVATPIGTTKATVTVTLSAENITNAQTVGVNVTVAGGANQATPTGTVTLSGGSYSAQQALSSGESNFSIAAGALANGVDTLTVNYGGDETYASASGTATITVSQVVIAAPAPSPVSPGGSVDTTVSLSAGSNYAGTMNLGCTLTASPAGAVSLPSCTLNPASVSLAFGGSGTTTLTVKTTPASSSALARPMRQNLWRFGGGAALAAVFLFGVPRRRRAIWMATLLLLGIACWTTACGGGGSSGSVGSSTPATPATTPGNYTFTVTSTDSVNTNIIAKASIVITVQ